MHFDFYEQYKGYSNVELLKILQQPDGYQPQAIDAATRLLEERKVTIDAEPATSDTREKKIPPKGETIHLLDSFLLQEEDVKSVKWLNIFLLLVAVEYLWINYNLIRSTAPLIFCKDCKFELILSLILLVSITYTPFIFYLLIKRKSWGWILMFFTSCFGTVTKIGQIPSYYQYVSLDTVEGIVFILLMILKGAFAYYLLRKEVRDFFHVSRNTKLWTVFAVIFVLVITLIYRYGIERSFGLNTF